MTQRERQILNWIEENPLISQQELAEKAGGNVVCRAAILAEGDAARRKDILFLEELPLFEKKENGEYAPIKTEEKA